MSIRIKIFAKRRVLGNIFVKNGDVSGASHRAEKWSGQTN